MDIFIKPNGENLCTKDVQNAIDTAFENGGGKVIFENGTFYLSTVFLKSNVHILILNTATILGAESFYKYFKQFGLLEPTGVDLPGEAGTIIHKKPNTLFVNFFI